MSAIRVLLVDDDPMVRAALRMMLASAPDIEVVGEAEDGQAGVDRVSQAPDQVDVVLMDIRMPVRDGLSATEEILGLTEPPKVIVLTTFDTDDMVMTALRLGAAGFLLKDTAPDRLVESVRSVVEGDRALSPRVTGQLIDTLVAGGSDPVTDSRRDQARERLAKLTERELEVGEAVARGLSNTQIAAELYMSVATVKAHVARILDKLGVDNRIHVALCVHDAALGSD